MNQRKADVNEEKQRERRIAFEISKKAVLELGIPNLIPEEQVKMTDSRYEIFYQEHQNDIILSIEFSPLFTKAMLHTSLTGFVWNLMGDLKLLFSNPKVLKLFAVEESEIESVINERSLRLAKEYMLHLPMVIFHSLIQASKEIIISHTKKFVEYELRETWDEMRLPKDFSLVPEKHLEKLIKLYPPTDAIGFFRALELLDEEFKIYRKAVYGNRKVWLTPEVENNLPDEYEKLRTSYKAAQKEYDIEHKAYFRINRRATLDDWHKHWEDVFKEKFHDIFQAEDIRNFTASQLAYRHLADIFGYSPEYMQKLITKIKTLANERKRRSKKTDI